MKKALIIFIVILVLSLAIPTLSLIDKNNESKQSELVTIFSQQANL